MVVFMAAFAGFVSGAMAQEPIDRMPVQEPAAASAAGPAAITVVPDAAAGPDRQTGPRIIGIETLPLDDVPADDVSLDPLTADRSMPEAQSPGSAPQRPATPPAAPVEGVVRPGASGMTVTEPTAVAAGDVATDPSGRFVACPDALLKAAYARMVDASVLQTFAIDTAVLKLCAERQELIGRILAREFDLVKLVAALPERGAVAATGPVETAASSTLPVAGAAFASGAADAVAPDVAEEALAAAEPDTSMPVVTSRAVVPDGHWRHLVRYRVRAEGGAWRAGIVSTWYPPPAPPVVLDDGQVLPGAPPQPDPPLETVVATGDTLGDGLVVEAITGTAVTVRGSGAGDEPWVLHNDPGEGPGRGAGATACVSGDGKDGASGGADRPDARDFIYCTLAVGTTTQ